MGAEISSLQTPFSANIEISFGEEESVRVREVWRNTPARNREQIAGEQDGDRQENAGRQAGVTNEGDGSGTGTGGTCEVVRSDDRPPSIQAFMGVWRPHVHHFDSNWRELRTLLYAMQFVQSNHEGYAEGATLFYFTDNLVTYYIVHNGCSKSQSLHEIIRAIKLLELRLRCRVEPIHVPGDLMIQQGADGLSRGIQLSSERISRSTVLESVATLQAVPLSPTLISWVLNLVGLKAVTNYHTHDDYSLWEASSILHTTSIWTPSPECAYQAIDMFLSLWVESPLDTAGIFLIPRIMQRDWNFMSRHLIEFGVYYPLSLPSNCSFPSLIPFCVLTCYPHTRRLTPTKGLEHDSHSFPFTRWVTHQANSLRRL